MTRARPLAVVTIAYLGAPAALFLFAYAPTWITVGAGIALCCAMVMSLSSRFPLPAATLRWRELTTAIVGAVIIVVLAGPLGPATPRADWDKHLAILGSLARNAWPVQLSSGDGGSLQFYLGLYIVPAGTGHPWGSIEAARWCMAAWMVAGIALGLAWVLCASIGRARWLIAPALVALLSGDWIAASITNGGFPSIATEDPAAYMPWAGDTLLPSVLPSMLWTPQHAIPALMIAGVFTAIWRDRAPVTLLVMVSALAVMWSPFAAAAGIGLALVAAVRNRRVGASTIYAGLLLLPSVLVTAVFLSGAPGPAPTTLNPLQWIGLLTVGIGLPTAVALGGPRRWRWAALWLVIGVAVAALVRTGVINDFAARTSLPLIIALWIIALRSASIALRARSSSAFSSSVRARSTWILAGMGAAALMAIPPLIGTLGSTYSQPRPPWADAPNTLEAFMSQLPARYRPQYVRCPGELAQRVLDLPGCRTQVRPPGEAATPWPSGVRP